MQKLHGKQLLDWIYKLYPVYMAYQIHCTNGIKVVVFKFQVAFWNKRLAHSLENTHNIKKKTQTTKRCFLPFCQEFQGIDIFLLGFFS